MKQQASVHRTTRTRVDTIEITPAIVAAWKSPPFQRPLVVNAKVEALAVKLKADSGVLPGVLTIGVHEGIQYLLDGQHRREGFLISGCEKGYCDVRYKQFSSLGDMGDEFLLGQQQLRPMRADDQLRAMEAKTPSLQYVRKRCPFVGYDLPRRSANSPTIGMSLLIRAWQSSRSDCPVAASGAVSKVIHAFDVEEAKLCADFAGMLEKSWGRDPEFSVLWASLNLTICMWLWRNLILTPGSGRLTPVTKEQFRQCLAALSAKPDYLEWVSGRRLSDFDRGPAYNRIKRIFAAKLLEETGKKAVLPQPPWADRMTSR